MDRRLFWIVNGCADVVCGKRGRSHFSDQHSLASRCFFNSYRHGVGFAGYRRDKQSGVIANFEHVFSCDLEVITKIRVKYKRVALVEGNSVRGDLEAKGDRVGVFLIHAPRRHQLGDVAVGGCGQIVGVRLRRVDGERREEGGHGEQERHADAGSCG